MRLFAAIEPPPEALDHLAAAVAALPGDANLRWTSPRSWHITLAFFGEVADGHLPDLTARLTRAARRHHPVELHLSGGGRFGDRALWVGCSGDRDELRALARSVAAAGRRAGVQVAGEGRFRPHVTLARARTPRRHELRAHVTALADYAGPVWEAREVNLIRSHLGKGEDGRPRYETLSGHVLGNGRSRR